MHEPADDPLIARVAAELRRPVPLSADFDQRVMAAVRAEPGSRVIALWEWLREPRAVAVSPLATVARAAVVAFLVLGAGIVGSRFSVSGFRGTVSANVTREPNTENREPVAFVFVAPSAASVALAGDFNGWQPTPLVRGQSGLWTVQVPLSPGRYQYAFVVDGRRFVADPAAPRAGGDDFGTPSSVVTVHGAPVLKSGGSL